MGYVTNQAFYIYFAQLPLFHLQIKITKKTEN